MVTAIWIACFYVNEIGHCHC